MSLEIPQSFPVALVEFDVRRKAMFKLIVEHNVASTQSLDNSKNGNEGEKQKGQETVTSPNRRIPVCVRVCMYM